MTSIRQRLKKLFGGSDSQEPDPAHFSYVMHWTEQVRAWDEGRRRLVKAQVRALVSQPGFAANRYQRTYHLPDLDEASHAGASLLALLQVLEAFTQYERGGSHDG